MNTKSAFITIAGKPNVGKSSLLNKLLGTKIAIVSSKPQTTRTKIMGVLTNGDIQFVFTDTPGFHKPHNKLGEIMNFAVKDSLGGTDGVLFVVEPKGELDSKELELIGKFKQEKIPAILVINKIDTLSDKTVLLERLKKTLLVLRFYRRRSGVRSNGRRARRTYGRDEKTCRPERSLFS